MARALQAAERKIDGSSQVTKASPVIPAHPSRSPLKLGRVWPWRLHRTDRQLKGARRAGFCLRQTPCNGDWRCWARKESDGYSVFDQSYISISQELFTGGCELAATSARASSRDVQFFRHQSFKSPLFRLPSTGLASAANDRSLPPPAYAAQSANRE